jgi:hypothetical protein
MNTVGNLGGAAAGYLTGYILDLSLKSYAAAQQLDPTGLTAADKKAGNLLGYQINLLSFALVYMIAVVLWLRIDSTQPVVPDEPRHSPPETGIRPSPEGSL